jgi:3-dehydroquinate dehydratase-1
MQSSRKLFMPGSVVGTMHLLQDLRQAVRLPKDAVDWLEARADAFYRHIPHLEKALPQVRHPLLLTVRDPVEGGEQTLTLQDRIDLYLRFLPFASAVDVEIRNARQMEPVLGVARDTGVAVVLSFHDFQKIPPETTLRRTIERGRKLGADCVKIAVRADTPRSVSRLVGLLSESHGVPLSLMGMGRFGRVSRITLGALGSVLNYGYLSRPNAPGQWPAALLKQYIRESTAGQD